MPRQWCLEQPMTLGENDATGLEEQDDVMAYPIADLGWAGDRMTSDFIPLVLLTVACGNWVKLLSGGWNLVGRLTTEFRVCS